MDTARAHARSAVTARRRRDAGRRVAAVALVTFRQGIRLRLWLLAPLALALAIVTDLFSPRFDPVFEAIPAAVGTGMLVMTVLTVILSVFFATYPTPAEMESRVAYTLMTKPLGRREVVTGKVLGLALLLAAMLALVGVGLYAYVRARAIDIRSLADRRLQEARPRTERAADLNPLAAVARQGPLATYRYRQASSGPEFAVRFTGEPPQAPGVLWVLGRTGMRLQWPLAETPLREWTASGAAHIELTLATHRPPGAEKKPVKAVVRLVARPPRPRNAAGPRPRPLKQSVEKEVPPAGTVRIPAVAADPTSPPDGAFAVPEKGDLFLEVLASGPGDVVGAAAGAVRIVGPGARTVRLTEAPRRLAGVMFGFGRPTLVGAPELPRQAALFRFDDVPAGTLDEGATAVEIAYSLDVSSPATVQPGARATFIRPDTGASRVFEFTPEGHHPTLLYLDRDFWHGGPLRVRLECLTEGDHLGLLPESVRLRLDGDPFALHLAKGTFGVLLFGTVLTAAAVMVSTRLSWFVSILGMVALLAVGTVGRIFLSYGLLGRLAALVAERVKPLPGGEWMLAHLQLQGLLPPHTFNMGEAMAWWDLGASLALVLAVATALVAAGGHLLRKREVAA